MSIETLPNGWTRAKLGDVAVRTSKACIPEINSNTRWVGADHLDEGDLSIRRWSTTDDPMFPPTFRFEVPEGSVLLHSRNPKKVAILPFVAITGEKIFCLDAVDHTQLSSKFLALQLQSKHFQEFVSLWLSGSVNKFLNWSALARYEFALPPLDEQQRMVETFVACDRKTEALLLAAESAVSLALSIFDSLVSTADVPVVRLDSVAEWRRGYSFRGSDYADDEGFPFLTLASVERGGGYRTDGLKYLKTEPKASCIAVPGDLLVANTDLTPGREFIGRPFLVPESLKTAGFSHHLSRIMTKDKSLREWLFWELQSPSSRKFVRSVARGSTVIMLDTRALGKWPVRVPPAQTRTEVLHRIRLAMTLELKARDQLAATANLRTVLLSELVGGGDVH